MTLRRGHRRFPPPRAGQAAMNGVPLPVVAGMPGHGHGRAIIRYAHVGDHGFETAAERAGQAIATMIGMEEPEATAPVSQRREITPGCRRAVRTVLDPSRGESGQVAVPVEGVHAGGRQDGDAAEGEAEECASLRHGVPGDGSGPGREAPFVVSGRTQVASLQWDIPEPACPRCMGAGTRASGRVRNVLQKGLRALLVMACR